MGAIPAEPEPEPDVLYHMIDIEIRCSDKAILKSYHEVITLTANHLGLTIGHWFVWWTLKSF